MWILVLVGPGVYPDKIMHGKKEKYMKRSVVSQSRIQESYTRHQLLPQRIGGRSCLHSIFTELYEIEFTFVR